MSRRSRVGTVANHQAAVENNETGDPLALETGKLRSDTAEVLISGQPQTERNGSQRKAFSSSKTDWNKITWRQRSWQYSTNSKPIPLG